MEDATLQAALERARAELQSATKELESERLSIEQLRCSLALEIDQAKAVRKKASGEMEAAQSGLISLEKQYERVAALLNYGVVAIHQMDEVTGQRDRAQGMANSASGGLEAAHSNYQKATNDLAGVKVREAHLAVLEAQVAVARAKVTQAEAEQDATILRAPGDGQVLERLIEVGGSAKVGEPIISLWLGRAWVEAWTDERDLAKFEIGSPVDIIFPASPGYKFTGWVEGIGLQSDKQLQPTPVPPALHSFLPPPGAVVPVRIAFNSDKCRLGLGLSAMVGIKKNRKGAEPGQRMVLQPSPNGKVEGGLALGNRPVANNNK
jgi:multidrug resistance efflux pump